MALSGAAFYPETAFVLIETVAQTHTSKMRRKSDRAAARLRSEPFLTLQLQSNPEALCLVRATLERATEVMDFPEADSRAIVRSVDEALTNVIRHAYKGRADKPIEVQCARLWKGNDAEHPKGLEIVLKDAGVAADPKKFKGRELNEVRPGGLGIHFMKQSMDVVEFHRKSGKNLLRMVKYLAPQKPQAVAQGE
ncbi:MAG TPA: ATP-binding protein [Dongiaceae bacterium]|nr:ATP-binding protein [Dongiaceae bacterium]